MERWHLIAAVVFGYLGLTLWIGLRAGRQASSSVSGYVAADREFGLLVMYFVTGATVFSAFAFLGGPGWAYSRGAAAYYILAYGVLGIAPWYWIGPRVAAIGRRHGYLTQAQLITGRFESRGLSVLLAVVSVAALIPYVTLQMQGAGIVIEAVTDGHVPYWAGSAIAYGIVVYYVWSSGVAAVGWTNTFQGVFMLVVAWAFGLWLPVHLHGGIGEMFQEIAAQRPELLRAPGLDATGAPWSWGAWSSSILVSAIGISLWPHLFMKAYAARDARVLRRTVILFPTFQLFLIPVFLIGFAGVLFESSPESADFILPFMILEADLPALVVGLFCAGALSASMSTGDAILHAAASVTVEDGVRPFVALDDAAQRRLIRGTVLATGVIAYGFALDPDSSLVVLLLTAYGIIAQLAPTVLATLYWRRATTAGVIAGLVTGTATSVFFLFNVELRPLDLHEGILGLLVHVPVLLAVSLLTRPQTAAHLERGLVGRPFDEATPETRIPRVHTELR